LSGGNIRMTPAHGFSALSALARFDRIPAHLDAPFHRYIGGRDNLLDCFAQCPAAVRATALDRYVDALGSGGQFRLVSKTEKALARFAPRRFGIGLVRAFGKRSRSASPLQLLDLRVQFPDHSMLVQNDLHQLLAAE